MNDKVCENCKWWAMTLYPQLEKTQGFCHLNPHRESKDRPDYCSKFEERKNEQT